MPERDTSKASSVKSAYQLQKSSVVQFSASVRSHGDLFCIMSFLSSACTYLGAPQTSPRIGGRVWGRETVRVKPSRILGGATVGALAAIALLEPTIGGLRSLLSSDARVVKLKSKIAG